eukprot:5473703-Amphidinium_carterae.2
MQVCFIVANVQSALLGLPDLDKNKVTVYTGDKPYLDKFGKSEQLHYLGARLHAAAIVLPRFYKPNEIKLGNTINTRYNPSLPTPLIGDIEEVSQQANIPKQLQQPPQPAKQEQESHRLTHMPYRSWCPICVKSKGLPTHHRRGALKKLSVIQLNYIRSSVPTHKKWQVHSFLTAIETTTGLCMAIPTSRKGPTRHQLTQLKRFVMENGFGQSIIKVGNEPAIIHLGQEAAKEWTIPWRHSSSHKHQGQGAVERLHKTLRAQTPDNVPEALLPWMLQYACFTINRIWYMQTE